MTESKRSTFSDRCVDLVTTHPVLGVIVPPWHCPSLPGAIPHEFVIRSSPVLPHDGGMGRRTEVTLGMGDTGCSKTLGDITRLLEMKEAAN